MYAVISAFGVGVLFALGFGFAGITRPDTIVGFLSFTRGWNPAIMFVMGTAVATTFVLYRLTLRQSRPRFAAQFSIPSRRDLDARLLVGAGLFGIGWGVPGYCPGPALASVWTGSAGVFTFLLAMVGGMLLHSGFEAVLAKAKQRRLQRASLLGELGMNPS